jgi:hypothetical protein
MKTKLRKLLVLFVFFGCGLAAGLILFRAPAPQEAETPAALHSGTQEPAAPPAPLALRMRPQPSSPGPEPVPALASVAPPEPAEAAGPPEDPDESRQWTRENPELALAWLVNAPAGPERDVVAEIACAQVAESDPALAVTVAERYAGGCTNLLENLVYQWSERDEAAARAYALARPAGEERNGLLGRVAVTCAKADPLAAATLVVQAIAPGEIQNEAAMSVLHQWALRDAPAALAWAQQFPEGDLHERAVNEVKNVAAFSREMPAAF